MNSFSDLIGLWPSMASLSEDCSVKYGTVRQWSLRNSIPAKYWDSIVAAAKRRKISGVNHKTLSSILSANTTAEAQS